MAGIYVEQALTFVILMLCATAALTTLTQYMEPGLPDTDDVLLMSYTLSDNGATPAVKSEVEEKMKVVVENLRQHPSVAAISKGVDLAPYMRGDIHYLSDSVAVGSKKIKTYLKGSDAEGYRVFKPDVVQGTWLTGSRLADGSLPVVITREFADSAGWSSPIVGKQITVRNRQGTVVGVLSALKQRVFGGSIPVAIVPVEALAKGNANEETVVRVKPGEEQAFSIAFYKEFNRLIQNAQPTLLSMEMMKADSLSAKTIDLTIQLIPTLFLFLLAFIGTFGIFLLRSRRRVREYALRIALGSTKRGLMLSVIF
ncbi:MAG: ABC transporter permease, partial [Prevotellaceae bacterium]|nr:ABC transporter permease [Prevotellaceae bacterium]